MRQYPEWPIPAVAACILDDEGRVLLVKRGQEPAKGKWSFPGGVIHVGEDLIDAVKREVKEECGLEISVVDLLEGVSRVVYDSAGLVEYHYVILDYLCKPASYEIVIGSDAADARWISIEDLETVELTDGLIDVIQKGIKKALIKSA